MASPYCSASSGSTVLKKLLNIRWTTTLFKIPGCPQTVISEAIRVTSYADFRGLERRVVYRVHTRPWGKHTRHKESRTASRQWRRRIAAPVAVAPCSRAVQGVRFTGPKREDQVASPYCSASSGSTVLTCCTGCAVYRSKTRRPSGVAVLQRQ